MPCWPPEASGWAAASRSVAADSEGARRPAAGPGSALKTFGRYSHAGPGGLLVFQQRNVNMVSFVRSQLPVCHCGKAAEALPSSLCRWGSVAARAGPRLTACQPGSLMSAAAATQLTCSWQP